MGVACHTLWVSYRVFLRMATKSWSTLALGLVVFVVLLAYVQAQPYDDHLAYGDEDLDMDYLDNYRDLLQHQASKRGRLCIMRGKTCSPKRNLCCRDWECRCNIFGANCKCERPGLFENNFYSPNFQFQTSSLLLHNLNSLIKARVSHIIKSKLFS